MSPSDRKAALNELNASLKAVQPLKLKENIDLVRITCDKIEATTSAVAQIRRHACRLDQGCFQQREEMTNETVD